MKKLILFILPVMIFFSCKNTEKTGFTVNGTISNASGKSLILNKFTSKKTIALDTIALNEKGEFNFKSSTAAPELYSIQLKDGQAHILFIADSVDNIKINADANDFRNSYTIEGSKDSKLLKQMYADLDIVYEKIEKLNKSFLEQKETKNIDSLTANITAQIQDVIKKHKESSTKFIEDNIDSPAAIMALYQAMGPQQQVFNLNEDRELFEKVNTSLSKLYPKSGFVKGLSDVLANNPVAVGIGSMAPEISEVTPDGKTASLSSFRGNYVLLDFWAAWCRPCRGENPTVLKNYNKYKSKGFTIFQVSLDKTKEDWVKAIEKDGLGAWTHVSDLKYWQSVHSAKYGVRSIPSNFLINPEGKIIAINLRGPSLGQKLAEIYGF